MSILPIINKLPILFGGDSCVCPSPHHRSWGLDPEEILAREFNSLLRPSALYYRPWRTLAADKDTGSTVSLSEDKFQVNLDVQQFAPDEISVKVTGDNTIEIEGKHEEKQDEHGFISRHFVRKYVVPKGHDVNKVVSNLSSDGVLTITAPKIDQKSVEERTIPIQQTGQPSKPIENKPEEKK